MIYDVAVIGAGPVGSMATRHLAEAGLRCVLVEEHGSIGEPCHCTGKLTSHAFEEFTLPNDVILNTIRGYVVHSPGNIEVRIRPKTVESHVIDREMFDRKLAWRAQEAGGDILLNTRALDARLEKREFVRITAAGPRRTIDAKLVIDAEGAIPVLLEKFGLRRKTTFAYGVQYDYSCASVEEQDVAHVFLGKSIAPGFLVWIVPISSKKIRVGLSVNRSLARRSPRDYLDRFIRTNSAAMAMLRGARMEKVWYGIEPIGGAIAKSYVDRFLVVGDAAGQVKSTSGGGIYFGLKAAKFAAETAIDWLADPHCGEDVVKEYQDKWMDGLGKELQFTARVREFLNLVSDDDLDRLFGMMLRDSKTHESLDQRADSAYQSRLVPTLIRGILRGALTDPKCLITLCRATTKWLASG